MVAARTLLPVVVMFVDPFPLPVIPLRLPQLSVLLLFEMFFLPLLLLPLLLLLVLSELLLILLEFIKLELFTPLLLIFILKRPPGLVLA